MSQLPTDTPGHVLREERKKQGKSLKEISRKLKINIKYLMAVEDEDYSLIPAEVFTKSYLRMYADILGLDSNDILNLYKSQNKVEEIQESPSRSSEEFYIKLKNYILPKVSFKPVLLIVVIVLVVLFISLITGDKEKTPETKIINEVQKTEVIEENNKETKIESVTKTTQNILETQTESIDKKVPSKAEKKGERKEKIAEKTVNKEQIKTERSEKKVSGLMLLEIYATELTWVSISIDGGKAEERVLRTGQTATVSALTSFAIKVGNAGGTRMVLDGEDLGALGPRGKVVDIILPVNDSET